MMYSRRDSNGDWITSYANHASNNWDNTDTFLFMLTLLKVGYMEKWRDGVWRARVDDSQVDYSYLEGKWIGTQDQMFLL